jgi:hypothetical protein
MKLHNLITDEICEAEAREDGIYVKANWSDEGKWFLYDLHTLASCWEYYVEPKKPLIKDEKIRKAVRAWAEVDGIVAVEIVSKYQLISLDEQCSIEFFAEIYPEYAHNEEHTIAELCGEEEE